jgi:16S rRNA (cytosine1402-N4)-methyltransferase
MFLAPVSSPAPDLRECGGAVAESDSPHVPVLLREVLEQLAPHDGGIYIDGTFGAGGYSRAILDAADCKVIGIDRDQSAVANGATLAERYSGRLTLSEDRFSHLDDVARELGHETVDGVVLDIGVSSMQLDQAERGFSFRQDGPLDMRMGGDGPSAADVIAVIGERDLANVIFLLGEERHSRAVARAIVAERAKGRIETTRQLADIVSRVVRSKPGAIHPATRTFQALRIFVNEELHELVEALGASERILKENGRLAVVTFHSLEDRIVKNFLADRSKSAPVSRHRPVSEGPETTFSLLTRKPLVADEDEIQSNPRARSAKLRAALRNAAPTRPLDDGELLPRLPSLDDVMGG